MNDLEELLRLVREIHAKIHGGSVSPPKNPTITDQVLERMRDGKIHTAYGMWEEFGQPEGGHKRFHSALNSLVIRGDVDRLAESNYRIKKIGG